MIKKRSAPARAPKAKMQTRAGARRQEPHKNAAGARQTSQATPRADETEKIDKGRFPKVIRDSFTMPVFDYDLIGDLKKKCLASGVAVKKSELLRAGLHALGRISEKDLIQVVTAVESVRTGRPPGKKKKKKKKAGGTRGKKA